MLNIYFRSFKLGAYYQMGNRIFQFIRVTNKGFNLLDVKTHTCLFKKKHLYSSNLYNKDVPNDINVVKNCAVVCACIFKEVLYNLKIDNQQN